MKPRLGHSVVRLPETLWPRGYAPVASPLFEYVPAWTLASVEVAVPRLTAVLQEIAEQGPRKCGAELVDRLAEGFHVLGTHGHERIASLRPAHAFLLPGASATLQAARAENAAALAAAVTFFTHACGTLLGAVSPEHFGPLRKRLDPVNPPQSVWYNESIADAYDSTRPHVTAHDEALAGLKPLLRGCDVLEIGAGTGRTMVTMRPATRRYVATELSPAMFEHLTARAMTVDAEPVRADAMLLPFEDNTFDVVLEENCLAFIQEPLVAVEECRRVLRPGGLFLRLLPSQTHPGHDEMLATLHTALVEAGHYRIPIWGKAEHLRIDEYFSDQGLITQRLELGSWSEDYDPARTVRALRRRSLPYLQLIDPAAYGPAVNRATAGLPDEHATSHDGWGALAASVTSV